MCDDSPDERGILGELSLMAFLRPSSALVGTLRTRSEGLAEVSTSPGITPSDLRPGCGSRDTSRSLAARLSLLRSRIVLGSLVVAGAVWAAAATILFSSEGCP